MTAAPDTGAAAGQAPDPASTSALPADRPTASVPWGAPPGSPQPLAFPADPPPAASPAQAASTRTEPSPRTEPAPDGLSPEEAPPTGLSDAQLAAEQQLIARRYPNGVTDSTTVLPAIPAASITPEAPTSATAPARASAHHRPASITCPECGASAMVEVTRRDALDFCQRCDFPLFWARDQVVLGEPIDSNGDALRRLPGTLGRVAIASVPCPHCNEPNLPTATLCVRCGLTMQASRPPAPPRPRQAPLPEPAMAPLEDEPNRWWIWLLVLLTMLLVAGIVLLAVQPWN